MFYKSTNFLRVKIMSNHFSFETEADEFRENWTQKPTTLILSLAFLSVYYIFSQRTCCCVYVKTFSIDMHRVCTYLKYKTTFCNHDELCDTSLILWLATHEDNEYIYNIIIIIIIIFIIRFMTGSGPMVSAQKTIWPVLTTYPCWKPKKYLFMSSIS